MNALLFLLTAVGVAIPLHAAEQTTTNLVQGDDFVAAVLKTARPAKAVPGSRRITPTAHTLFSHSLSLRHHRAKDEKGSGGSSTSATTNVIARSAATSAQVVSTAPAARPLQPTYELVPMTVDDLAERKAIIGWRIKRKE